MLSNEIVVTPDTGWIDIRSVVWNPHLIADFGSKSRFEEMKKKVDRSATN